MRLISTHQLLWLLGLIWLVTQVPPVSAVTSLKEMRERGIVMQQWENSCAAASVATVLTYGFNHPVSERTAATKMLEMTDPDKVKKQGGFSLLDLKKFVESRGFVGNAYKNLGLEDLRVFHAPIVPIDAHGYNHYVVFNGVMDDAVLLADPAYGNREMSLEKFNKVWLNGIAFVVTRPEPVPETPVPPVKAKKPH